MLVIAIDGPAAAGKGTLARRLAAHLGLDYLDSGSLYRAVAWRVLEAGTDPADPAAALVEAKNLSPADLSRPELRSERVGKAASAVAQHPAVRTELTDFQRRFAARPPSGRGAVIDGRDIGTVVCPEAQAKLFVTASSEERARRRTLELQEKGEKAKYDAVLEELKARDRRDMERAVAPLVAAPDARVLDTTDLGPDAAFAAALEYVTGLSVS